MAWNKRRGGPEHDAHSTRQASPSLKGEPAAPPPRAEAGLPTDPMALRALADPIALHALADPIALCASAGSGRSAAVVLPETQNRPSRIEDLGTADFRAALAGGEFTLAYQPIVSAATGAVTGCEALLRWHHPSLGPVSPTQFVPLAERTGDIGPIGAWVLEAACRQATAWPECCRVSVNVSPVQLQDPDFTARVVRALRASGLPARRLELELTEGVAIDDVALEPVRDIRALGVNVALDDFGTGFSSLGYLKRFTFDRIKIDRSFIRGLGEGSESRFLVRTMHDIAHHFGMAVTAEGIETEEEARLLREMGSAELQGFLFARPMASAAVLPLLGAEAQGRRRDDVARQPALSHAAP